MRSSELILPDFLHTINFELKKPGIARKTNTYLRLLGLYVKQNQGYVQQAEAHYHAGAITALREHVHAIKGVSGNMGMIVLYEYAVNFEQTLGEGETIAVERFRMFVELVEQSLLDAEAIISANAETEAVVKEVTAPQDVRPYSQVKCDLLSRLETFAVVEAALIKEFQSAAKGHLDDALIPCVISYLEAFDYDEAMAIIR